MVLKIVSRYITSKSAHNRSRVIRIFLGLALSTAVLLSVISIMNYLQTTRFEYIKQVRSFPVTVETDESGKNELLSLYGDRYSPFAYKEGQALMTSGGTSTAILVRYIDDSYQGGLYKSGDVERGGILVPYLLYTRGQISSPVTLTSLESGSAVRLVPRANQYTVTGFFSTALGSDFDTSVVFLELDAAGEDMPYTVAFHVSDGEESKLYSQLEELGYKPVLWSDRETSLYSAMVLEKVVMEILLSSLFLIVLVQIIQNASSLAKAKQRESAALLLMGFSKRLLDKAAVLTGALLAAFSMIVGTVLAFIITKLLPHINPVFAHAVFTIDITSALLFGVLMVLFSALSYFRAFRHQIGRSSIMEVVSTV